MRGKIVKICPGIHVAVPAGVLKRVAKALRQAIQVGIDVARAAGVKAIAFGTSIDWGGVRRGNPLSIRA